MAMTTTMATMMRTTKTTTTTRPMIRRTPIRISTVKVRKVKRAMVRASLTNHRSLNPLLLERGLSKVVVIDAPLVDPNITQQVLVRVTVTVNTSAMMPPRQLAISYFLPLGQPTPLPTLVTQGTVTGLQKIRTMIYDDYY